MSSVWNANNIIDGFSPRPNTPIIIIWGSFFDTNRKYSQWHNPNEWKMAQHIPTRHKEGITRSILRSVRRATATLCSVPNHWTIIFKIRQTKKHLIPTCMQSGRRHGTACHSYGFFIRTKRQKKKKIKLAPDWRPSTDIHTTIYHHYSRHISFYEFRCCIATQSNFECQIESINFSLRTFFLIRLPTAAINPSLAPYIYVSLHLSFRVTLPIRLAWNCTAQRLLWCMMSQYISIEPSTACVLWCSSGKQQ